MDLVKQELLPEVLPGAKHWAGGARHLFVLWDTGSSPPHNSSFKTLVVTSAVLSGGAQGRAGKG